MRRAPVVLLLLLAGLGRSLAAAPAPAPAPAARAPAIALVVTAPGYPGTTEEAQPAMDALSAAVAAAADWPADAITARYEPTEKGGLARLGEPAAAVAIVPLPFLVAHGAALRLRPRLAAEPQDGRATESWSLVARKGRVARPADLAGVTVVSTAGYAPAFVRGALADFGRLPATAPVSASTQVLSALRKAAAGESVAVLLDGAQAAALPSLPFAADLEVVARSRPMPAGVVVTVGGRLPPARWTVLERALLGLRDRPDGAAALDGLRLARLAPLDGARLEATVRAIRGDAP